MKNLLCGDDGTERVLGSNTQTDEEAPEHHPGENRHGPLNILRGVLQVKPHGALRDAQGTKDDDDQLEAVQLPAAIAIRQEAEDELAEARADEGDDVDLGLAVEAAVVGVVVRPVDKGQARQDDIGGEEVVRVREEARGGDGPDLPVEAAVVDDAGDLLALVVVGLELSFLSGGACSVGEGQARVSGGGVDSPRGAGLRPKG